MNTGNWVSLDMLLDLHADLDDPPIKARPPARHAAPPRRDDVRTPPNAFRGYFERRGRAHWIEDQSGMVSFCGITRFEGWLGTGSQDEHDSAARRRICRRCERRAAWKFGESVEHSEVSES